jgi:YrbI family 3-deoxy-D-manno-octulosonate 8-phosphate phosphatase
MKAAFRRVRALALDVDGVLTDGGMYYGARGQEFKRFDTKDGMGLRLVQEAGVVVAFITAEKSGIILRRAEKLKVRDVFTGVEDKLAVFEAWLAKRRVAPADAAYMGDDVNDLPPMRRAGLALAPADAVPAVRKAARWVASLPGGRGAVREACEAILAAR